MKPNDKRLVYALHRLINTAIDMQAEVILVPSEVANTFRLLEARLEEVRAALVTTKGKN